MPVSQKIKITIADSCGMMATALLSHLSADQRLTITEIAERSDDLLVLIGKHMPRVILMDETLNVNVSAAVLVRQIREYAQDNSLDVPLCIVYGSSMDGPTIASLLDAGACSYLHRRDLNRRYVLDAIDLVLAGRRPVLSQSVSFVRMVRGELLPSATVSTSAARMTENLQRDLLLLMQWAIEGLTNEQITQRSSWTRDKVLMRWGQARQAFNAQTNQAAVVGFLTRGRGLKHVLFFDDQEREILAMGFQGLLSQMHLTDQERETIEAMLSQIRNGFDWYAQLPIESMALITTNPGKA